MPEKTATTATYSCSLATILASFTLNDLAVLVGIIITILTFAANLWFQWDKRRREIEGVYK